MDMPNVFIASSVEGLDVAYAVQELLEYTADCTVWNQGVFEPNSFTLIDLLTASKEFDFGVFVFTPDDVLKLKDETYKATRDNVILELGLFLGALGRERCIIISPRSGSDDELHMPTDLAGLSPIRFKANRGDERLEAALGSCANQIKRLIKKYGLNNAQNADKESLPKKVNRSDELAAIKDDDVLADRIPRHNTLVSLNLLNLIVEQERSVGVWIAILNKLKSDKDKLAQALINLALRGIFKNNYVFERGHESLASLAQNLYADFLIQLFDINKNEFNRIYNKNLLFDQNEKARLELFLKSKSVVNLD